MNKSKLLSLIEDTAFRYVELDYPNRKDNFLSVEYMLVAIMKLADTDSTDDVFSHFTESDKVEHKALKKNLSERKITISRDEIRKRSSQPSKAANEALLDIESFAINNAKKAGHKEIRAHYYLDAIFARPTDELKKITIQTRGENAIGKMYSLSRQKQDLKEHLLKKVIGQDEAINTFVDGIISSVFFEKNPKNTKPRGIFVFAGPPGVGKTFLAETGAEKLGLPVKRFDMSEYSNGEDSIYNLIGTDPTWRGRHEGQLTSFVKACNDNGKGCFIIFDEIEKAHSDVIHLFLQMLDAGRLSDKHSGYTASFENAYIIFTTNAGRSLYENGTVPRGLSKSLIINALRDDINPKTKQSFFPDAILSRFESGYAVMFQHLSASDLVEIGMKEMKHNADLFRQTYGPDVEIDADIPFLLLLQKGGESDARSFRSDCEKFICNNLIAIGDAVHEEKLNSVLRRKNRIHFTVSKQHRDQLGDLFPVESSSKTIWIISEDEEHIEDFDYEFNQLFQTYKPTYFTSTQKAIKGLKTGLADPCAIIFDLKSEDGEQNATQHFASKNPVVATAYQDFCDFMDCAVNETPHIPIYALVQEQPQDHQHLVNAVYQKGVTTVFSYESIDEALAQQFSEHLERQLHLARLQKTAFSFAREHKSLSFTVSPNEENNEVAIRLLNFKKSILVSGSDTGNMLAEDRMPNVTFKDYIGGETTKNEMREFIAFLKNPAAFCAGGNPAPKGVLLYGPPGTGKTFLAKAMANEAGVPFFFSNGSSFVTELVGSGPKAVRNLFATARKYAPAIVFIDEIDAIGKKRTGSEYVHSTEETLNMLLSEMDGFETDQKRPVFVIAATNYSIDQNNRMALDPALVRRFTRTIYVDLPNQQERLEYFLHCLAGHKHSVSQTFMESIAKRSVGMNFGNMNNVVEKAIRDAHRAETEITEVILDDALETVLYGEKKDWGTEYLERTAWHEAGHAYMNWRCGQTPEYITITARGDFGGYVMPASTEGKTLWTKNDILDRVKVCLAGRASEIVRYGKTEGLSTGPSQDIKEAGRLLTGYVCDFGMDDELGLLYVPNSSTPPAEVRNRIHTLLSEIEQSIIEDLTANKGTIQAFVDKLLAKNKLSSQEIEELLNEVK